MTISPNFNIFFIKKYIKLANFFVVNEYAYYTYFFMAIIIFRIINNTNSIDYENVWELDLVPGAGIEPARPLKPQDFKSCVSTNFTTRA